MLPRLKSQQQYPPPADIMKEQYLKSRMASIRMYHYELAHVASDMLAKVSWDGITMLELKILLNEFMDVLNLLTGLTKNMTYKEQQ